MYDAASSIMMQKLSQLPGVGQVFVGGSALPAVRVDLNPTALSKYGISLETVRGVLTQTSVNRPQGHLSDGERTGRSRRTTSSAMPATICPLS